MVTAARARELLLLVVPGAGPLAGVRTGAGEGSQRGARIRGGGLRSTPRPKPGNPALIQHAEQRRGSWENRVADQITQFAGSMRFVYLHIIWFGPWIVLRLEHYLFGLLIVIVSLEAIFLSTFVMISQNRADEKRQVLANQQWRTVQDEGRQNDELLRLSDEIIELTKAIHATSPAPAGTVHEPGGAADVGRRAARG